jgi:hypothetical protein
MPAHAKIRLWLGCFPGPEGWQGIGGLEGLCAIMAAPEAIEVVSVEARFAPLVDAVLDYREARSGMPERPRVEVRP